MQLDNKILPKVTSGNYRLKLTPLGVEVVGTGVILKGSSITEHLKDCDSCTVFSATLGFSADRQLTTLQHSDLSKALELDAYLNQQIESVCDEFENNINKQARQNNQFTAYRFSPGYGDFSLEYQKDFLMLSKNRDIKCTPDYLLLPTKSVTAIIGISQKVQKCISNKCDFCSFKDNCANK